MPSDGQTDATARNPCAFCGGVSRHAIHAVDGAESRRYQIPVCDEHWRDYVSVVDHGRSRHAESKGEVEA